MKLPPITIDVMRQTYELLAACPPFVDWNLPPSEDISFGRTHLKDLRGRYYAHAYAGHTKDASKIKKQLIRINPRYNRTMDDLLQTMAHEMIHLHEHRSGMMTQAQHSEAYLMIARDICKRYGWRSDSFVFGD